MLLSRTSGVHQRLHSLQIRLIYPLLPLFFPEMTPISHVENAIHHVDDTHLPRGERDLPRG
jgi:hypothetical protein